MNVLAIPATTSSTSINRQLLTHAGDVLTSMAPATQVEVIDLYDYDMPIYRSDFEAANGIPAKAKALHDKIGAADALMVSFAEHNSNYTAAWKNAFDWMSRLDGTVFQDKPMVIMAASPGGRGGASVLGLTETILPFHGGVLKGKFSLPTFQDNFADGALTNPELAEELKSALSALV